MFDHCLYFNTTALARRLEREWTAAFKPFGLTPSQAFLLRVVLAKPGLLQRELAEEMGISRPTTTRALDGLVAKGLVVREASQRDGREWSIAPTNKATALHRDLDAASGTVTKRLKRLLGEGAFVETVAKVRDVRAHLK